MRPTAGLDVGDVLGVADIRDVEDSDAPEAVVADGLVHAFAAAVQPSAESLTGDEEQIAGHGHVAL